ncbi:MAG TPA: uroporphyrinogen-III C-methyltransferase [Candidatus Tyrphobacter sp.]
MTGSVALVGAGPGDPTLLTLRGAQALREAEVLLYDALASDAVVAFAPRSCERIYVGKRGAEHAMDQRRIESLMIGKAREGRRVVRLKGGDPFVFGRGAEEAEALRAAGVPFEVVPGITSAIAAPAYAGIPLTHREHASSFTVATGHEDPEKPESAIDWARLADPKSTLVFLMGVERLESIARSLIEYGLAPRTPVALVQDGTRPSQRCITATLATIALEAERAGIRAPAVAIVGEVVGLREDLRWFDRGALFGKRVLITRTAPEAERFANALLARGIEPILAPTIEIHPPEDPAPARRAIEELERYAWIVFTSRNGVEAFFDNLHAMDADARFIGHTRVAAIGPKTARCLEAFGVRADLVCGRFTSEDVARELLERTCEGERVLIYAAQEGRDVLRSVLEQAGRVPAPVAAYATRIAVDPEFAQKVARADVLTFTSGSTVRGFAALLGGNAAAIEAANGKLVACIGPITAGEARDAGLQVDVVAKEFTAEGLLSALEARIAAHA